MILSTTQIEVFLFIFARIMGIFLQAPVFSSRSLPSFAKVSLAIWIASVLWFVTPVRVDLLPPTFNGFMLLIATEVLVGFLIGFACNVIFIAIQSAGELMDLQMGLSVSQAFDPLFGASTSIIGRLMFFVALITFLLLDGHHLLLSILHQSFVMIPVPAAIDISKAPAIFNLLNLVTILWTTAIQLAGPIILIIFLSDFSFGIVSRVAPQVNVFMLGFQVKPSLGLLGLLFALPILVKHIASLLGTMGEEMLKLLSSIKL